MKQSIWLTQDLDLSKNGATHARYKKVKTTKDADKYEEYWRWWGVQMTKDQDNSNIQIESQEFIKGEYEGIIHTYDVLWWEYKI